MTDPGATDGERAREIADEVVRTDPLYTALFVGRDEARGKIERDLQERIEFLLAALPEVAEAARGQLICVQSIIHDYFNGIEPREPWGPAS